MITRKRWEGGNDAIEMLNSVYQWKSMREAKVARDRKIQLYVFALCRQVWDELPWLSRMTTGLSEQILDGTFAPAQLRRSLEYIAEGVSLCAASDQPSYPHHWLADYERYLIEAGFLKPIDADLRVDFSNARRLCTLGGLAEAAAFPFGNRAHRFVPREFHSVALIRDIFGNPFRSFVFDHSWRTSTAVSIAQTMYESRDFSPMPILADALEDAGCDHPDILTHCRGDGPHVRGCWVVDLVLGKQ